MGLLLTFLVFTQTCVTNRFVSPPVAVQTYKPNLYTGISRADAFLFNC